ncbi:hypothetical protein [Ancylobacter terrae]
MSALEIYLLLLPVFFMGLGGLAYFAAGRMAAADRRRHGRPAE